MTAPQISVIVAAYNAMPYLEQCLESVRGQSLPEEMYEVIVVDDGSTDGTSDFLARLTDSFAPLRVFRQENSGGPAAPRNRGLSVARGEYVFFLDADDYLGRHALERMSAMADRCDSDIVLGRMVGVNGRRVPTSMFDYDAESVDLFDSRLYWALNPLKLLRRRLIEDLDLRFPTDLPVGQDQPFVATAYLNARRISVVGGYDCYYARLRDDGGNNTLRPNGATRRLPLLRKMFSLVPEAVGAGPDRDLLLRRHFQSEQREFLEHLRHETDQARQEAAFDEFRELVSKWCTPEVANPLPAADRLRLELVRRGRMSEALAAWDLSIDGHAILVEDDRAFVEYPGFRDSEDDLEDALFDVTDEIPFHHEVTVARWRDGVFELVGNIGSRGLPLPVEGAELLLRRKENGDLISMRTDWTRFSHDLLRFEARLEFGDDSQPTVPSGRWDLLFRQRKDKSVRTVRLGQRRSHPIPSDIWLVPGEKAPVTVTAYGTRKHGNLTFDVGDVRQRNLAPGNTVARFTNGRLDIRIQFNVHELRLDDVELVVGDSEPITMTETDNRQFHAAVSTSVLAAWCRNTAVEPRIHGRCGDRHYCWRLPLAGSERRHLFMAGLRPVILRVRPRGGGLVADATTLGPNVLPSIIRRVFRR